MHVCIDFGNAAVQEVTSDQGIDSAEELWHLDEGGVANLCKVVCVSVVLIQHMLLSLVSW